MRRKYIVGCVIGFIAAISVGFWLSLQRKFDMYSENAITRNTGIYQFVVLSKVHNDFEWYVTIRLKPDDVDKLLKRYPFKQGFSRAVLEGKTFDLPMKDCPDCLYYYDGKSGSTYDYDLYLLKGDRTEAIVYEVFGN